MIASPRLFGGGRVICRSWPQETIDISEEYHNSEILTLPNTVSGGQAWKANVSIFCGGPWVAPNYFTADFQVRMIVEDELYTRPNVRRQLVVGEFLSLIHI